MNYELLIHPPYSSDLTPSDFHLFATLMTSLTGKRFELKVMIVAVDRYFVVISELRLNKCIFILNIVSQYYQAGNL